MVTLNISTTKAVKTKSKVTGDNWLVCYRNDSPHRCVCPTPAESGSIWSRNRTLLSLLANATGQRLLNLDRQRHSRKPWAGQFNSYFATIPAAFAVLLIVLVQVNHSVWVGDLYENTLSSSALAYVFSIYAAAILCLGPSTIRKIAFPLAVGLFTAPFPVPFKDAIVTFFQYTSAEAAYWMLKLAGNTIYRDGLVFALPSITMEVAPQCSGIRSSLVLFLVAWSHLNFLKNCLEKNFASNLCNSAGNRAQWIAYFPLGDCASE